MAAQYESILPNLQAFIENQKIFFVATAAHKGRINLSPKGLDSFRILDANRVVWLNLTGSGNETAAHLLDNNRMTIMFCAFEGKPLILRLYGSAKTYHERDSEYSELIKLFPNHLGARQIYDMNVEIIQTSCGFAVPFMDYREDRDLLEKWTSKHDEASLKEYWKKKNTKSIDGFPTGIFSKQ